MSAKLSLQFDKVQQRLHGAQQVALVDAMAETKFEVIGELYKTKSGRVYGPHTASAPGESPASDSKKYENATKAQLTSATSAAVWVEGIPYDKILEYGGEIQQGDKTIVIAARPMWAIVIERMRKRYPELAAEIIGAALK